MKWRKILEKMFSVQETQPQKSVDIFRDIYGLETVKRLTKQVIHASKPVNAIIIGPPGLAKSEIMKAIAQAYPDQSVFIDGTYVTAAGTVDKIHEKLLRQHTDKRMFLLIDEIEKSDKKANQVLLNIIEGGRITKTTKTEKFDIKNINIALIATCNDFETLKRTQPALVSRVMIIKIEPPTLQEFMTIAKFRLARENIGAELAMHIAAQVYKTFGTDMRVCVRVAIIAKTPEDVDQTIKDMKEVGV